MNHTCHKCREQFPKTPEHFFLVGGKYFDRCCKKCRGLINYEAKIKRLAAQGRTIKLPKEKAEEAFEPNEPILATALRNLTPLERAWKGERP